MRLLVLGLTNGATEGCESERPMPVIISHQRQRKRMQRRKKSTGITDSLDRVDSLDVNLFESRIGACFDSSPLRAGNIM